MKKRLWWHKRDYAVLKLLAVAVSTFLTTAALCAPLTRPGSIALWLLLVVPLVPIPVMVCMGFFEQRMRSQMVLALMSSASALLAFLLFLRNLTEYEVVLGVVIYIPAMWVSAMLGAVVGVTFSKEFYEIVRRPPGTCPNCGYCLRGLTAQICPECGRDFVKLGESAAGRARRRAVRGIILTGSAVGIILSALPHRPGPYCTQFGWPLHWLDFNPIEIEMRLGPGEKRVIVDDMWRRGVIGPTGAPADWAWGWLWARVPNGPILIFSPVALLGNVLIALVVVLTLRAVGRAWAQRRDARLAPGHCRNCGYDLTGNVSGRCPECGTAVNREGGQA